MAIQAFVAPILPGKTEEWRRWVGELNGSRKHEFDESRRRYGLHERSFLQSTPMGDMVIVTVEGENPAESFKRMAEAKDDFTQWFVQGVKDFHGIELKDLLAQPMPELIADSEGMETQRRAA